MEQPPVIEPKRNFWDPVRKTVYILGTLILFLFALDLMISSLQNLGNTAVEVLIMATSNPFTGLFIGLLITAMIQSSSTTTSLTVALVASGSITLESALPIIMGANVGTTITSTIVSLGFISKRKEFRRAVAAGTYHDFFNILTVVILFPLEYYYGFLSSLSTYIAQYFFNPSNAVVESPSGHFWPGFDPLINFILDFIPNAFVVAGLSFALLFSSIILFRKLISNLLLVNSPERFSGFFFKNKLKSFLWGLGITAAIRSSTITTSLVVPIVAKKIVSLSKAAPFILGANIGTTITAFIASALNPSNSGAISIAIGHFLFNVIGFLIFFPLPMLRKVPIELANALGRMTLKYRLGGFVYILITFFFLPFSLIYLNKGSITVLETRYEKQNLITNETTAYHIVAKMNEMSNNGEWIIYNKPVREPDTEPDQIFPVYWKKNILVINNEMHLFNRPGFCWDGENNRGKFKACIVEVLPELKISEDLRFDSVYVYSRQFYNMDAADSISVKYYIGTEYPLILKREVFDRNQQLIREEKITNLEIK